MVCGQEPETFPNGKLVLCPVVFVQASPFSGPCTRVLFKPIYSEPRLANQYSLGNSTVVDDRSASVIIQIFVPSPNLNAERIRKPSRMESSFSARSSSSRSP